MSQPQLPLDGPAPCPGGWVECELCAPPSAATVHPEALVNGKPIELAWAPILSAPRDEVLTQPALPMAVIVATQRTPFGVTATLGEVAASLAAVESSDRCLSWWRG